MLIERRILQFRFKMKINMCTAEQKKKKKPNSFFYSLFFLWFLVDLVPVFFSNYWKSFCLSKMKTKLKKKGRQKRNQKNRFAIVRLCLYMNMNSTQCDDDHRFILFLLWAKVVFFSQTKVLERAHSTAPLIIQCNKSIVLTK